MTQNPPEGKQKIVPYLYYDDGPAALEYMCKVFGFEELMRVARGDGTFMHAEAGYQGNAVMLGTPLGEDGKPKSLREHPVRHASVMCYVDDVDAHYAKARAAGAEIVSELADQSYGARTYTAADPEGHHWHFTTPTDD